MARRSTRCAHEWAPAARSEAGEPVKGRVCLKCRAPCPPAPGEYLKRELHARGWTQADLAMILGRPPRLVNEIINGKRAITARTAIELSAAVGGDAFAWLQRETAYRLSLTAEPDSRIAARARAREKRHG